MQTLLIAKYLLDVRSGEGRTCKEVGLSAQSFLKPDGSVFDYGQWVVNKSMQTEQLSIQVVRMEFACWGSGSMHPLVSFAG